MENNPVKTKNVTITSSQKEQGKEIVNFIASSNGTKIQNCKNRHFGFKKVIFKNLSIGGLSMSPNSEKHLQTIYDIKELLIQSWVIIWIGMNSYKNNEHSIFVRDLLRLIQQLLNSGINHKKLFIITPLVRGIDLEIHEHQVSSFDYLVQKLRQRGIESMNPYHLFPKSMKDNPKSIFSPKDLKKGDFIHYNGKVRQTLHNFIGNLIKNL